MQPVRSGAITLKKPTVPPFPFIHSLTGLLGLPLWCSASGIFAEASIDSFQSISRKRVIPVSQRQGHHRQSTQGDSKEDGKPKIDVYSSS